MNAIQKWRTDQKLTLKQAGELLGVSEASVCRYENDNRLISPRLVGRVSQITGIDLDVLRPDLFGPVTARHKL